MNTSKPPGSGAGTDSLARSSSSGKSDDHSSAPLQPSLGDGMSGSGSRAVSQSGGLASSRPASQSGGQASSQGDSQDNVAASLTKDVKEAAKTTTRAVKQQASDFASDIGHELSKTAEDQKTRGVEAIQGFTRVINTAADQLESQSPLVARYVRDAAEKVEGLSENISSRNVQELLKATSDLARAQPLLFLGGAVAAGFALSRFLKSSARNTSSDSSESDMSAQSGQSSRSDQYSQSNMSGRSSPLPAQSGSSNIGQSTSPHFPARS
jgi:hypothetical protein